MVSTLIVSALIFGGHRLLISGGEFLIRQGELGEVLLERIFYLGWSIIFYLLVLSNLITGFSTFYRSPEVAYLYTLPLDFSQIFKLKFAENLIYSSWAILILGVPMTLAYGQLQGLTGYQYVTVFLLGVIPFLFIATATAALILILLVSLSRHFRMRTLFVLLGLGFAGVMYLYFQLNQQETMIGGQLGNFRALGRYITNLSSNPFSLIPSFWLSQLYMQTAWSEQIYYWALFLSTALVGWEVLGWLSRRYYFQSYQVMEAHGSGQSKTGLSPVFKIDWPGISPPVKAVLSKDIVQFLRTPQQWVQFLLLGFFILVYLINLSRGRGSFTELLPFWQTMIYVFNFGFAGFIMAALTARFVYPMISMEGRSLWMLQMSPFSMKQVFLEKFWLAFAILFLLTEFVVMASNYFLGYEPIIAVLGSAFLLMTSLALISMSLGLGAVYAQFNETNPMKISSGYGGIISIVLSLIYVGLSVVSLVFIIRLFQADGSGVLIALIVAFAVVLTTLYTWLPLRWGLKALSGYEP